LRVADRTKALQASQQKLQTGGGVMSDVARAQLERDIERQQRDLERLQQDAQGEITEKTQEVQADFNKKLFPILEQLSVEKGLHLLFSAQDAGLIWASDGPRPDDGRGEEARRSDRGGERSASGARSAGGARSSARSPHGARSKVSAREVTKVVRRATSRSPLSRLRRASLLPV